MKLLATLLTAILFTGFVYAQNVLTATTTIDSAASVTDTLDLYDLGYDTRLKLIGIEIDTPWTDANLTFLVGDQAGASATLAEMFEMDGTAVTCTVDSTMNNYFALKPVLFAGLRFLQIRSGTQATPVAQGDERTIKLYLREY
jgi:hypothetical protein